MAIVIPVKNLCTFRICVYCKHICFPERERRACRDLLDLFLVLPLSSEGIFIFLSVFIRVSLQKTHMGPPAAMDSNIVSCKIVKQPVAMKWRLIRLR